MRVTARYFGLVSQQTNKLMEELTLPEQITVKEVIEKLGKRYGLKFEQLCFIRPLYSERDYFNVTINAQDLNDQKIFQKGLDTQLQEGDIVSFGPIGGAA